MTIYRERDWFGKVVQSERPAPGFEETLIEPNHSDVRNGVRLRVVSEDSLHYMRGSHVANRDDGI